MPNDKSAIKKVPTKTRPDNSANAVLSALRKILCLALHSVKGSARLQTLLRWVVEPSTLSKDYIWLDYICGDSSRNPATDPCSLVPNNLTGLHEESRRVLVLEPHNTSW